LYRYTEAGDTTWPITTFSYLYIRKDLTSLGRSGAAVKAFAEFVVSKEGQSMVPEFGFEKVPDNVLALAAVGAGCTSVLFYPKTFLRYQLQHGNR
jgi:hypothetical protein